MTRLAMALVVWLAASVTATAGTVATDSPEAFTTSVTQALNAALTEQKVPDALAKADGALAIAVALRGERRFAVSVERPWALCHREPASCETFTHDYVSKTAASIASSLRPATVSREQLRVLVRASAYVEQIKQTKEEPVIASLAGDLWAIVVVDTPEVSRPLRRTELAPLGLETTTAFAVALENVIKEVGPLAKLTPKLPDKALGYLTPPHYYDCGLLSAPQLWSALAKSMKKPLVVSVPSDQVVLFAEATDAEKIGVFKAITEKMFGEAARPVSKTLLQWSERGWTLVR